MLTTYFKRQTARASYYTRPVGPYLDEFTDWLEQQGYRPDTIRHRLQGAAGFGAWVRKTGCHLRPVPPDALDKFRHYLSEREQLHVTSGPFSVRWLGARLFVEFLRAQQNSIHVETESQTAPPALIQAFEQWMQAHRGVKPSTLANYRRHLIDLLATLGEHPGQWDAAQLRTFVLNYTQHNRIASAKTRVKATRAFLRFLIATEYCQAGLEAAIPAFSYGRLSTLPGYLSPEDIDCVIAACESTRSIGIRDKAIVLLLARLGLRAGEVAELKFDAIDWSQGTFTTIGKSRREAKLPLPQDVGDAMLHYLDAARPAIDSDYLFITAIAPWKPISPNTVSGIAAHAIRRAGIEASSFGAHILRHSAATGWLRQGASLQTIGEILRHRDTDTTAQYAKVDVALLERVTRPWPGAAPC